MVASTSDESLFIIFSESLNKKMRVALHETAPSFTTCYVNNKWYNFTPCSFRHRCHCGDHDTRKTLNYLFVIIRFKDKLIVHLKEKICTGIKLFFSQCIINTYHRDLHKVRSGTLKRGIQCHALRHRLHERNTGAEIRKVTPSSKQCLRIPLFRRISLHTFKVCSDLRKGHEILIIKLLCFITRRTKILFQRIDTHSINNPKVNDFCTTTHFFRYEVG